MRKLKERCYSCSKPIDPAWRICPFCEAEPLVHVTYVFGDALRQANGRVWPRNSLADLHRSMDEVACYVVEVCTACYWNHLAQRYLLGRRHVG